MSDVCNSAVKSSKNIGENQSDNRYSLDDEFMNDLQETSTPTKRPFQVKSWSHQKLLGLSPLTSTPKRKVIKDLLSGIDVYNSKPTIHKPLEIKFHSPKYSQPFYTSKFLDNLTISDKVTQIKNLHLKLTRQFHKIQRKSIFLAESGNPILLKPYTNGLTENEEDLSIPDFQEQEIYVSRGGRQIKRKVYKQDDFNSDSDEENKKKKTKCDTPKQANTRRNISENFIEEDDDNFKIKKERETPKIARRTNLKNLNNAEIMSRSSLFADKPKTPRAERLFNALKQENTIKAKVEKEIEIFERSLNASATEEDCELRITSSRFPRTSERPTIPGEPDTGDFIKMRIIPPSAKNKGGSLEPIPSSSNMNKTNVNGKASTSKGKKMTTCPICNQSFLQKEIEEHASTCGLTSELEIENNLPIQDSNHIKCNICDKVCVLNTDYEVHVKQCIENLKRN